MLTITIPGSELYDEETQSFIIKTKEQVLQLEHSLVSLSKWESKWKKPFLTKDNKTREETIDYVRCMTITQNVDNDSYLNLSSENIKDVQAYIEDPMTATTFYEDKNSGGRITNIITAEIIYYWMIEFNIPVEFQKWHLNRLLTLIKVCNEKRKTKKMSKSELFARQRELNAARRRSLNTSG